MKFIMTANGKTAINPAHIVEAYISEAREYVREDKRCWVDAKLDNGTGTILFYGNKADCVRYLAHLCEED